MRFTIDDVDDDARTVPTEVTRLDEMFAILMLLSANLVTDTSAEIWNSASQVAVVVVCDATTSTHCANSVDLLENTVGFLKQGCEYNLNGSLYIKDQLVPQDLPDLEAYIITNRASFVENVLTSLDKKVCLSYKLSSSDDYRRCTRYL